MAISPASRSSCSVSTDIPPFYRMASTEDGQLLNNQRLFSPSILTRVPMKPLFRSGVAVFLFLASLIALGCGSDEKKNPPLSSPPAGERVRPGEGGGPGKEPAGGSSNKLTPSGPYAAGMKAFNDQNCGNCHTVEAGGRSKSPNLSQVGKEHDATWLAAHIKNPKRTNRCQKCRRSREKSAMRI